MVGGDEAGAKDEGGECAFLRIDEEAEMLFCADFICWSLFRLPVSSLSSIRREFECFRGLRVELATPDLGEELVCLEI